MQPNNQITSNKFGLFFYLAILTLFFVLFEISVGIKCSHVYLGDVKLIASHLSIPYKIVLPGILYYVFVQLLIHSSLLLLLWLFALLVGSALAFSQKGTEKLGISLWFFTFFTILLANSVYYPNSKFSGILGFLSPHMAKWLLYFNYAIALVVLFIASYRLILFFYHSRKTKIIVLLTSIGLIGSFFLLHSTQYVDLDGSSKDRPNVIIVGVDSLRPDYLSFFSGQSLTPHMDYFLKGATVFSEALTPLARTYPSWVAILSGQHPKVSQVRTNLEDQGAIDFNNMLPTIFKKEGYDTFFATDETRFSNIDEQFGFDHVIEPPIGFNDFLLGTLNDFPLSNLLVNTHAGKYLFPHSYGNRAVYITYQPNTFLGKIKETLSKRRHAPFFMAIHFCLTHYPYSWSALPQHEVMVSHYLASVKRIDQQFYDFMQVLKTNQLLNNSIVILLSDHGEALELLGDRITDPQLFVAGENNKKRLIPDFYPPTAVYEKVNQSGGHGTDVLGLSQYHSVLAFRSFGFKPNQKKVMTEKVSLLDIKPTLLSIFNLTSLSGSLWPIIFGTESLVEKDRDFFVESDFSPTAIHSVHPETRQVLFEGIDYFRIDPLTSRVLVKDDMLKMIISSKQYADYFGSWVLALYPKQHYMIPILVNRKTGEWTNDLNTPFAKQSPASHMLAALKAFYGDDIKEVR